MVALFCVLFFGQYGLVLPIWVNFIILVWIANCGLKAYFVILNLLCNSDVFVILRRLCHSGLNFSFWDEFVILGWICDSWLNLSFEMNLSFWADFVIQGRICHSGLICYSGLVSFWDMFIILGWLCHSGPNLLFYLHRMILLFSNRLLIFALISHCDKKLMFWTEIVILGW